MKVDDKTHIPGKYTTALKSYDEMLENFQGISEYVIKELYKTYFRFDLLEHRIDFKHHPQRLRLLWL